MANRPITDPDWYAVLDVVPSADEATIKAAHRRIARTLHPDVNPAADATMRMAELNRARDVLLDAAQRAAFDRRRQSERPAGSPATPARPRRAEPRGTGERMQFSFGEQRPANRTDERTEAPSTQAMAREAARWRFDRSGENHQEDWYAFLDLAPWSTGEEVRQACARLAKEATRVSLGEEERLRRAAKLRVAAETLGNAERKKAYDESRPRWQPGARPLPDYYRQLGLQTKATPEEVAEAITSAHLALGKIRTPEARAKDTAIREAHWVLRDPARRAAYDAVRRAQG